MTNIKILAATFSTACCMNYVGGMSALAKGLSKALSRMFAEDAGKVARKLDNGASSLEGKAGKFEWFGHSAQSRVLVKIAGRHGVSWFSIVGNREPMAYTPMPADDYRDKPQSAWPVPDIIDWRYADQPIVTQTGDYMAISYAVVAGMENALKRKFDLSVKLSENRLVSVSRSQSIDDSFTAAAQYGLVSTRIEALNGFTLGANHTYASVAKMSPVVFPLRDNSAVTNAMKGQHPVILVLAIDDAFRSNRGGVLTIPANQPSFNHAVTVVGYRLDKANPAASYYIIRNSWGTEWGDKGYAYLPMNYCQAVRCAAFAVDKVTIQDEGK